MIVTSCQRWRDRRGSYRPTGEVFTPGAYDVALLPDNPTAKAFVVRHHYSRSYPSARARVGLFHRGELVGVLVASHPVHDAVLDCLPGSDRSVKAELGRLVLRNDVPSNAESWTIARAFELLRAEGFESLVSFSDPFPRTAVDGSVTFAGHVGTIYQATNARFVGRGRGGRVYFLPDGSIFPRRAIQKIKAAGRERGWDYASRALTAFGAEPLTDPERGPRWLARWLPQLTRTAMHPGNLKYLFGLDRRVRKHLPASLPYPKLGELRVGSS